MKLSENVSNLLCAFLEEGGELESFVDILENSRNLTFEIESPDSVTSDFILEI